MSRSADGVTLLYTFLHADCCIYVILKDRADSLVLVETELVEGDILRQDIPALIEEIITEQTETIIREHPTIDTLEECFSVACSRAMENKRAVYHIYHSVKRDLFEKELFRICEYAVNTYVNTAFREEQMPESDRKILARFIKCELFGLIIEWLEEGMQQDAVSDLLRITELCRGMAAQLIRRSVEAGA